RLVRPPMPTGQVRWVGWFCQAARLYGTTQGGGLYGAGVVFALDLAPNSPPLVACSAAPSVECGSPVQVTVNVSDPDGDALTVLWTIGVRIVQTNMVLVSNPPLVTNISFVADLPLGTNIVGALVVDQATNTASCSTSVNVIDTIPPAIVSAVANP